MPRIYDRTRTAVLMCSALSAILGLFAVTLIIWPDLSIRTVSVFLGIVGILFGITRIIGYFSNDPYRLAFEHDIILGSVQILIGITLIFHAQWLWETICLILGFVMLTDSMFKFRMSLEARRFGLNRWALILAASIITCILGLVGIFMPDRSSQAIVVVLGISILSYSIMNLITVLTAVKITKKNQPIIIEEVQV